MLQFDVLIKSLAAQGAEICRFFKRHLTLNTLYLQYKALKSGFVAPFINNIELHFARDNNDENLEKIKKRQRTALGLPSPL